MTAPTPHPAADTPPHQAEVIRPMSPLSARQAAAALGINEKTVRRRIERGEITATKDASGAYRIDPTEIERQAADTAAPGPHQGAAAAADSAADMAAPGAAPVDLAPLADLIADLTRQNAQLTEAAAVWQVRAIQAEERLKQLTAGDDRGSVRPDEELSGVAQSENAPPVPAPESTSAPETHRPSILVSAWRRLFGSG